MHVCISYLWLVQVRGVEHSCNHVDLCPWMLKSVW